jgi:hypothetical protein
MFMKEPKHVAFLSSLSEGLWTLREQLHSDNGGKLWVAEKSDENLKLLHPLARADACITALISSEVFICVLAGEGASAVHGGTPIELDGLESLVSFFEIEVFEAALHSVPLVLLMHKEFRPGRRMEEFLRVLRRSSVVAHSKEKLVNKEIILEVRHAIKNRKALRRAAARGLRRAARTFASELVAQRANLRNVYLGGSDMLWLRGMDMKSDEPDGATFARAKQLLAVAKAQERHDVRLSRLYHAFRDLMTMPYRQTEDREVLHLWDESFGLWCGSAAWFGLHNHVALGVIGGLWSQDLVRQRLMPSLKKNERRELVQPWGSLASAYYSLSRLCTPRWRLKVADVGIELANRVISRGIERDPGILAVRGSLFFSRLRPDRGMTDFRNLLKYAESRSGNTMLVGEAHMYLGKGYTLTNRSKKAIAHLEASVRLWRTYVADKRSGREFLVKALKNLLETQIKLRQRDAALKTAQEAITLALQAGINDQLRQLKIMASEAGL